MTGPQGPGAEWDSHLLLLYRDEGRRQDSVALWIQRGLDRGERVLYYRLSDEAGPVAGLAGRGVDIREAARRGQFSVLPVKEFFPVGGQAALVWTARDEGYPGVRLSARAEAAPNHLTEEECQASDRTLDALCASLPVSAMCQYDSDRTIGRELATVVESHAETLRDAQVGVRRRGDVVFVAGEVDLESAEALRLFLHRACELGGGAAVLVDLSEPTFVDMAGCRAPMRGTGTFRAGGGTGFLRGAHAHVTTLLGMDRLPGVQMS